MKRYLSSNLEMMQTSSERRSAISQLSRLMKEKRPFSYLRMGDGELQWLLRVQQGQEIKQWSYVNQGTSVDEAFGVNGLKREQYKRLLEAYEQCSYIDLYERVPYNQQSLPALKINFSSHTYKAAGELSHLIFEWTYFEFGQYVSNRKCLFACAESLLLEQLYLDPRYRQIAIDFWTDSAAPIFMRIQNDGRYYWDCLDEIKESIRQVVINHQVDTVFISLGTGAKILCYELAEELGICTFDLGSVSRALAYAGSPGYQAARDSHFPFLFRVPFNIYMEGLEKAYPEMSVADLLSKAHAQLCIDLQRKIIAGSTATDVCDKNSFDPSPENLRYFWESFQYYKQRYVPLAEQDKRARELIKDFNRYRVVQGLGVDGYIFKQLVSIKGMLRKILKFD
ncbi:hypothetical protein H6G00_31490 [Leptolyngbya sp. FACHB-541]|uniref:hypothetical protein n=1 Tax=Leptolyngbya sp. FACHB-541 TaxID=2692810 RepID=UPI001687D20E|nr:hypothetical protein [Leptolyngbya sp. FACHB-541]MBD2001070.1 hypothetical protein [Leptolyngbya sp. FACHB-541]